MNGFEKEWKGLFKDLEGQKEPLKKFLKDKIFLPDVPNLMQKILNKVEVDKYDALLVDEGQDFVLEWWQILVSLIKEKGEKILVADQYQNIYERQGLWTEASLKGGGLRGSWNVLDVCYRLPRRIITLVQYYTKHFLPSVPLI